jgi:hypothetical protein
MEYFPLENKEEFPFQEISNMFLERARYENGIRIAQLEATRWWYRINKDFILPA